MDRKRAAEKKTAVLFWKGEWNVFSDWRETQCISDIGEVLGAGKRQDGYLSGADCIVSWCLGHLAEYVSPEVYDSRYENGSFHSFLFYRNIGSLRWQGIRKNNLRY